MEIDGLELDARIRLRELSAAEFDRGMRAFAASALGREASDG